jgi:galactonate dehydratase
MRIAEIEVASSADPQQPRRLIVHGDSGLSGVSEIGVDGRDGETGIASRLRDLLIGREPFDVEAVWAAGVAGESGVELTHISAATSAMLDLAAKDLKAPAYQLLGGAVHDAVRACAIGWAEEAIGRDDVVAAAKRAVASGYTLLRIEPFAIPPSRRAEEAAAAIELVQTIREGVPDDVDLVISVDDASSTRTAEFIAAIAAAEPLWVEVQGLESATGTRDGTDAVARAFGRGMDPDTLRRLVIDNVADHLVLEVDRIGGILEARRIAALAEVFYVGVITACADGALPLRDTLCLAATVPNLSVVEVRPGLAAVEDGMLLVDTLLHASLASSGFSGLGA